MGTQEYRANYKLAMQEANSQLAEIFREFESLHQRKELLEDVLGALDAYLPASPAASYERPRQEPVAAQPARYEPEHVPSVAPVPVPVAVSEPVAPAPFAPVPEVITDPIQSRINRALGLAVA